MRQVGKLLKPLSIILVTAGAGALAYRVLLTDEARQSLKNSYSSIKSAYERVSGIVADARGVEVVEDEYPNQESTRLQWEALGF